MANVRRSRFTQNANRQQTYWDIFEDQTVPAGLGPIAVTVELVIAPIALDPAGTRYASAVSAEFPGSLPIDRTVRRIHGQWNVASVQDLNEPLTIAFGVGVFESGMLTNASEKALPNPAADGASDSWMFHRWIQGGLVSNAVDLIDVLSFPVQVMDVKSMRKIPDGKALAFVLGAVATGTLSAPTGGALRGIPRVLFSQK